MADCVPEHEVRDEKKTRKRIAKKHECQKCGRCYAYVYHRDRHEEKCAQPDVSNPAKTKKRLRTQRVDEVPQTKKIHRTPYLVMVCPFHGMVL